MGFKFTSPPFSTSNKGNPSDVQPTSARHSNRLKLFWRRTISVFNGTLKPFRLLKEDTGQLSRRYASDWQVFNQLILASAVYVFFTNLLPGITFASDLYTLTGQNWGTIEVVLSTGLCGIIFSL